MAIHEMKHGLTSEQLKKWPQEPLPMDVSYEGAVLELREENGPSDSDFYAIVWDDDDGIKRVTYASTRGWTYPNHAEVDATDEVRAKAAAWAAQRRYEARIRQDDEDAKTPAIGKRVRVIRKTKVDKKGVEGVVFWVGEQTYGRHHWARASLRVGVEQDDGERFFINAASVKVIAPDQYRKDHWELWDLHRGSYALFVANPRMAVVA